MTGYDYFRKILLLIGFIILGIFVTVAFTFAFLLLSGLTFTDVALISEEGIDSLPAGTIRVLLAIQHTGIFIFPCLLFGLVVYRAGIWHGLDLWKFPSLKLIILGIAFLLFGYPLVNLSYLLNEAWTLPSWAGELESQAEITLRTILAMDSPWLLLINLLIIAVLPGIGEELLFRGIGQNLIGNWLRSPVAGIWISALIFSMIHMQFEGFLPRLVLGALLGYLYYWTKNLWVPIIAHAFNNGIQVALIYFLGADVDTIEEQGTEQLEWWMLPLSIFILYAIYSMIIKKKRDIE